MFVTHPDDNVIDPSMESPVNVSPSAHSLNFKRRNVVTMPNV